MPANGLFLTGSASRCPHMMNSIEVEKRDKYCFPTWQEIPPMKPILSFAGYEDVIILF